MNYFWTPSPSIQDKNISINASEALKLIQEKMNDADRAPVVVLDLDATLYDNRPRVLRILNDIINENKLDDAEFIKEKIGTINPEKMKYRVTDTLEDVGITDQTMLDHFFKGWMKRFFTNEYVVFDLPNPGAVKFADKLRDMGITIVYLTGRDTPGMRKGTLDSLKKDGFPYPDDEKVFLITKPTFEESDKEFKSNAIAQINNIGNVLATFDNEPAMNNTLARSFPQGFHVFLDTMHSTEYEDLLPDIFVMKDFLI